MNNSLFSGKYKQYFVTAIVTVIVVVSFCLALELELMFRTENKVNTEELNMANLARFCTIEELEKRLASENKNYFIVIKLAQIYESLEDFSTAKEYYERALKQSGRSNFALYNYALFCANRSLFALSATLAEELSGSTKQTRKFKAAIYEAIGDNFDKEEHLLPSIKAYQIAYKYYKILDNKTDFKRIQAKYVKENSKYADKLVSEGDFQEAVFYLKNSLKIKETPIVKYKLGIAYKETDKVKAEKLINEVFKKEPFLVNPYIYDQLLEELVRINKEEGDINAESYYSLRLNNFRKKLLMLYLYKGDIDFSNTAILTKWSFLTKKKNYYLVFNLKNRTSVKINRLFLKFEVYLNDKKIVFENKAVSETKPLDPYELLEQVKVAIPNDFKIEKNSMKNTVTIKYFAKINKEAPWTLMKIDLINI